MQDLIRHAQLAYDCNGGMGLLYDEEIRMRSDRKVLLDSSEYGSRSSKDGACLPHLTAGDSGCYFWSNICLFI